MLIRGYSSLLVFDSEIPLPVIDVDGSNLFGCEGNVFVPANLYDAALAGNHLIEALAVLEGNGNHLISRAGIAMAS